MSVKASTESIEELESKIMLLGTNKQNAEFLETVRAIMGYASQFDIATTETRILTRVFPEVQNRFSRIFTDNNSLFETLDDELLAGLIKENLEIIFQLTEIIQEILHYIYEHGPAELSTIESILNYLPKYVQLFADHWKNSSDAYKNAFMEETSKIVEVMKHLYASFLYLLEFSIRVPEDNNDNDVRLLTDALTVLCQMPKALCEIDASTVISSWTCFRTITTKYSSLLENFLDVQITVKLLTEDICQNMEALFDHNLETFRRQLKIIIFLTKTLIKITHIFYQRLNHFALELLVFYVRVLSFWPEYHTCRKLSTEALLVIETDIYKSLDEFLRHLIMGQSITIMDHLGNLSKELKKADINTNYPFGFLSLLNKILGIIGDASSDWSEMIITLTEDIFDILPHCHKELFLDVHDGGIYQHLIVNMSAAVLLHDANFCIPDVLLKRILHDNVFLAVLALEIYTLVVSNIPPEECLTVLINLLYGVDDLICGFFTHRQEMVHLKYLLQRLFRILPDTLKEQVIKLFRPDQYIQIWRFLGFFSLSTDQLQLVLEPVVGNTSKYIRTINQLVTKDMPLNIAEGLELISTVNDLNTSNESNISEVESFMVTFWSSDINSEIINNNLIKYFVFKISVLTARCIQSSSLDPHLVFPKLELLLNNQSYWMPIFKIIFSIVNCLPFIKTSIGTKQDIISQIAGVITIAMDKNTLLHEIYLETMMNLNESHNDILNMLLDSFNANVANQIFEYIERSRKTNEIIINNKYFTNTIHFAHVCLKWNTDVTCNNEFPPKKRFKLNEQDYDENKVQIISIMPTKGKKPDNNRKTMQQKTIVPISTNGNIDEDKSSATEVIDRIKGEMKCLINICKTEKLTQKNVAHLRILASQMSSLM